jgi:hypothetical protein
MALGPATPTNPTILAWLATVNYPNCAATPPGAPPPPPLNPATLAVTFWRTIPLPVPHPRVPPGYAITGKPAYLVTGGTTNPRPFVKQTPLGPLTITAHGSYTVDWGDATSPTWTGPYTTEGQPWPNGNIAHTYDNVGTVSVTLREAWTASWSLAGATGTLTGLATTASIPDFAIRQVQAVITN